MYLKGFYLYIGSYGQSCRYITIDDTKILIDDLNEEHIRFIIKRGMHGLSDDPLDITVEGAI